MSRLIRPLLSAGFALLVGCNGGSGGGGGMAPDAGPGDSAGDPFYERQWHLKNTGQSGANGVAAAPGEDINVEPAWQSCDDNGTCKGEGVTIAVVDTGLQIAHPDLQPNVSTMLNHRLYSAGGPPIDGDPTPQELDGENAHGTGVAGIAAARDGNHIGVRGAAPRASLLGYGLMQANTLSNRIDAMTYQVESVAVSNNSWGPPDGTGQLFDSDSLWRDAVDFGLANGRNGRGTIYVWSAGNGGNAVHEDLSNYDGFANYRGVIAVGALNARGGRTFYTEGGANLWISAPGGEFCQTGLAITTTDFRGPVGRNTGNEAHELADGDYTQCMNGTSSAAPLVSGVIALMLQANPSLGWRDVRRILALTARQNDPVDALWATNAAGRKIHYYYGFGAVDAAAAINAARGWTNLPAQRSVSVEQAANQAIPDNNETGVSSSISISGSGISRIEWVDVHFSASSHTHAGDLGITLVAPSGTRSVLAVPHSCDGTCIPYEGWRFGIARHLDEAADGDWRIIVQDRRAGNTGTFESWRVTIHGH